MTIDITHTQLKQQALAAEDIAAAYSSLEPEKALWRRLAKLRQQRGYTQDQVAKKLKTSKSTISRLESGGGKHQHSSSLSTLRAYVTAIDYQFDLLLKEFVNQQPITEQDHGCDEVSA